MKKINFLLALVLLTGAAYAQTVWNIDKAHSKIGFSVVHMVVAETEGNFKDFDAKVTSNAADFDGADVEFSAKVASIDTENENRDKHLKSPDFFEAEKYPEVKFAGKLVKAGGKYQLKGKLTLKETTKDVAFDVTYGGTVDTGRGMKAGFKLNGKINRQDYNLKWANKMQDGSAVVSDDVDLLIKIELNKAQA
jgi:polyisoprenoid-binding protein YceI